MRHILQVELWALIGALLLAAGLPYVSAALGWAATQDGTSISMRADIAVGVAIAVLGSTILAVVLVAWALTSLRRRRTTRPLAG